MLRYTMIVIALLLIGGSAVQAANIPLPPAPWYAVTWVESTDTLHWINPTGEQASIPRPRLDGQISQTQTRLYISPNGRTLVVISPLNNGREAIGFYDFAAGQFAQIHESEPNEVFLPAGRAPFSEFSAQFVIPLRHQITGAWRMIVFDTATGDALEQLQHTDPMLPPTVNNTTNIWPYVAQFNVDEALNTSEVRFKMIGAPGNDQAVSPSLKWTLSPSSQSLDVVADVLTVFDPEAGFDIHPMTGEGIYAGFDPLAGLEDTNAIVLQAGDLVQVLASEGNGRASYPRWLHNGDWFGYWRDNGVLATHWLIRARDGGASLPLSPNIIDVYHTADGLLAKDSSAWRLDHVTTLDGEGFAEPSGKTVFAPGEAFAVVYTTPANTEFNLGSVAEPGIFVGEDIAPPPAAACGNAPAPRLSAGMSARVTFTDGASLRVRTAPAGQIVTQIAEGTTFTIIDGPQCVDGYHWWNIRLNNGTTGWAAEGDSENYFIEPFEGVVTAQPPVIGGVATAQPPVAQITPMVLILPTATPAFVIQINCPQSPPTQLAAGQFAHTSPTLGGTLALYPTYDAEFPTAQIGANTGLITTGGPACRANGQRMWQVEVMLNGQQTFGWVAEGFGQQYFLLPGMP